MKVDSTTSSGLQTLKDGLQRTQQGDASTSGAGTTGAGAAAPTSRSTSGGDANVSLSGLSGHLHGLASSGAADIDTAHVDSIKQAIRNGSLTIDSGKIADGVLETARNLLQNKSQSTGN